MNSLLLCSILLSQNGSFSARMETFKTHRFGWEKCPWERERESKTNCLYRGTEWETKRQMAQQGETERGKGRRWEWWEQRGLLPTQYSVVHVWVSSNIYLIWSRQAELCNSKAEADLLEIILTKVYAFVFGKNVSSLICFCFV